MFVLDSRLLGIVSPQSIKDAIFPIDTMGCTREELSRGFLAEDMFLCRTTTTGSGCEEVSRVGLAICELSLLLAVMYF